MKWCEDSYAKLLYTCPFRILETFIWLESICLKMWYATELHISFFFFFWCEHGKTEVGFNLEALLGSHFVWENPVLAHLNRAHLTSTGQDPSVRGPSGNSWSKCWEQEGNQRGRFASFRDSLAQACLTHFEINGAPSSTLFTLVRGRLERKSLT